PLDRPSLFLPLQHVAFEVDDAFEAMRLERVLRNRRALAAATVDDHIAILRIGEFRDALRQLIVRNVARTWHVARCKLFRRANVEDDEIRITLLDSATQLFA